MHKCFSPGNHKMYLLCFLLKTLLPLCTKSKLFYVNSFLIFLLRVFLQQHLLQQPAQQHRFTLSTLFPEERVGGPFRIPGSPRHSVFTLTAQLHVLVCFCSSQPVVSPSREFCVSSLIQSDFSFWLMVGRITRPTETPPKLGTPSEREVICVSLKKDPKLGLGKDITLHWI